jgi:vacuolar-type H+-ATPase subunit H
MKDDDKEENLSGGNVFNRDAELIRTAKNSAREIVSVAEKRSMEILEESKLMAHEIRDRILESAKAEIEAEMIR